MATRKKQAPEGEQKELTGWQKRKAEGLKQMNIFVTPEQLTALNAASAAAGCANRNEFILLIFSEWLEGTDLLTPAMKQKLYG